MFCFYFYFQTVSVSVSVMTLCAISVERWYAICRPLSFHSTERRARLIIAVIWFLSACIAIPELVSSAAEPFRSDTVLLSRCYPKLWTNRQKAKFLKMSYGGIVRSSIGSDWICLHTYSHCSLD